MNVPSSTEKLAFTTGDLERLFGFFAAFMAKNEATAHGESELSDLIDFIKQFSSIPHSAVPPELLPKIVDMILRCRQNDKLALQAEDLLRALVDRDPTCCEVVLSPGLLSFVLNCARGIERSTYQSSWHQQLFGVITVALATEPFGPLLRQYVTCNDELWLKTIVGCIASGLDRFQLRALPIFVRFLLTFAEEGCDDELLIDHCLGGIAKLLRAELTEAVDDNLMSESYYAANLVYELMKSPGFSLDSLRAHRYDDLITRTFFNQSLTCWWTFVLASIAESGNDIAEFIHIPPEEIADRITRVPPVEAHFLLHVLALMYDVTRDIPPPASGPVMALAGWIVEHIGDGFGFVIKKQMMLCLFVLALRSDRILFDAVFNAPELWEDVLPLIVGLEPDQEVTWAVHRIFATAARRVEAETEEDAKALLRHSALIALLDNPREPAGIENLDAARMEFLDAVGRLIPLDDDDRAHG
jgi:hypothetical protein